MPDPTQEPEEKLLAPDSPLPQLSKEEKSVEFAQTPIETISVSGKQKTVQIEDVSPTGTQKSDGIDEPKIQIQRMKTKKAKKGKKGDEKLSKTQDVDNLKAMI